MTSLKAQRPRADALQLLSPRASESSVIRHLSKIGVQPARSGNFVLFTDPSLLERLYMSPPTHTLALCVDEKSRCQALEHMSQLLAMGLATLRQSARAAQNRTSDDRKHRAVQATQAAIRLTGYGRICSPGSGKTERRERIEFFTGYAQV